MESLFTFIIDYMGGTYVSQVNGNSPDDAMLRWVRTFDFQNVLKIHQDINNILRDIEDVEKTPLALNGMKNIWSFSLLLDDELALVNVVKTDEEVS